MINDNHMAIVNVLSTFDQNLKSGTDGLQIITPMAWGSKRFNSVGCKHEFITSTTTVFQYRGIKVIKTRKVMMLRNTKDDEG